MERVVLSVEIEPTTVQPGKNPFYLKEEESASRTHEFT